MRNKSTAITGLKISINQSGRKTPILGGTYHLRKASSWSCFCQETHPRNLSQSLTRSERTERRASSLTASWDPSILPLFSNTKTPNQMKTSREYKTGLLSRTACPIPDIMIAETELKWNNCNYNCRKKSMGIFNGRLTISFLPYHQQI